MNQIDKTDAFEKARKLAQRTWTTVGGLSSRASKQAERLRKQAAPKIRNLVTRTSDLLDTKVAPDTTATRKQTPDPAQSHPVVEFDLPPLEDLRPEVEPFADALTSIVVGQERTVRLSLCCFIAGGHLLLDGAPGLGKTTLAQALGAVTGRAVQRIQFTADLMPSDLLGVPIFDQEQDRFVLHKGPVFSEIVLADEVNRAPPRAQSALLEAMAEGCVSIDGETHPLPAGFFVVATQNPLGQIGAFPLPESQLDRFLMRLSFTHPKRAVERNLLSNQNRRTNVSDLPKVDGPDLRSISPEIDAVKAGDRALNYLQDLVEMSRDPAFFRAGLSVRASLALLKAARSWAWMHDRHWIEPEDIQHVFLAVAEHRLVGQETARNGPTSNADQVLATVRLAPEA